MVWIETWPGRNSQRVGRDRSQDMSPVENRVAPVRIRVRQGQGCVVLAPESPLEAFQRTITLGRCSAGAPRSWPSRRRQTPASESFCLSPCSSVLKSARLCNLDGSPRIYGGSEFQLQGATMRGEDANQDVMFSQTPPQSGWLDELGPVKRGRFVG